MICEKCKKSFLKPLELYNGESACPICHESLSYSAMALKVTEENEELFRLSEICYLRALKSASTDKKTYSELLAKAIEYCKDSAHSGHPKALLRLGYMYEMGYFSIDGAEAFKRSCEYYKTVWNGNISDMRAKGGGEYSSGGVGIKKCAAKRYLNLIKNAPAQYLKNFRTRYAAELAEIRNAGLFSGEAEFEGDIYDTDRTARIFEILQSCFSKEKAPLFGLLKLEEGEFEAVCSVCEKVRTNTRSKLGKIAEKVFICIFDAVSGNYNVIKSERDFASVTAASSYLYFFNSNGKHLLTGRVLSLIKKSLEKSDAVGEFARVNELISIIARDGNLTDYVFADDDVIVNKSKLESWQHAVGDLIKSVQKSINNEVYNVNE